MDNTLDEARIWDTVQAAWPFAHGNPPTLLHGDYWPGNVLWKHGQLAGVIDWEDAALGDPLIDLALSRQEIVWALGFDTMQRFTEAYQAVTTLDFTALPYWDLWASLRPITKVSEWAADADAEATMRAGLRRFIEEAFAAVAASSNTR
jgi:aminoglycoside phosphotransferase (APT) family kinase protein